MAQSKHKKILLALFGVVLFLGVGIAIPKLTVHDLVDASADRSCINEAINPPVKKLSFKGLLFLTGKTQVVNATSFGGEAKLYTLFRIPLDFFTIRISCDPALKPITLKDGEAVEWLGTFHDSSAVDGMKSYTSDELGISLKYPEEYLLFHNSVTEMGIYEHFQYISMGPKDLILQTISRARAGFAGEGPYMVNLSFFYDPKLKVANVVPEEYLKRWLIERPPQSNYYPDGQGPGTVRATLTPITIDGVPAFKYKNLYGLYESDVVAFIHNDRIVIASSPSDPSMSSNFETIISSLQLK